MKQGQYSGATSASAEELHTWDWVPQVSQTRTPLFSDQEEEKQMGQSSGAPCMLCL